MKDQFETEVLRTLSMNGVFEVHEEKNELKKLAEGMLQSIGENPHRQGLLNTPARFSKALSYLTSGYQVQLEKLVGEAIFDEPSSELVFIKDIEFYSLCEHHMLPFFGRVHVAYVPNGKIIGLSKIPRLVDAFARRLQVQERLTSEVAGAIQKLLAPKGVAVIIEASHLCMMMRGVQKQKSSTVTKSMLGEFRNNEGLRSELLSLLSR